MKINYKHFSNKFNKLSKYFIGCSVLILMGFAIFMPDFYINSANSALILWATNLLPALFPFFVFTKIIVELNILRPLSKLMYPFMKLAFNTGINSGYLFFVSLLCGYPIGSKIIVDAYKNGQIDYIELHRLITITSVSGPLFIVGTVGISMLTNSAIGYVILIAQILTVLINGLLYRSYVPKNTPQLKCDSSKQLKSGGLLVTSINSSIESILLIGGLVVVFFVGVEVLNLFIQLPPLTQGFIELTKGCYEISLAHYPEVIATTLSSALIAFGGFCIHAQSYYFLAPIGVNYGFFLAQKCTQLVFSIIITFILANICL